MQQVVLIAEIRRTPTWSQLHTQPSCIQ